MGRTATKPRRVKVIEYPTSDGKPMAETDWHRDLMLELIETLKKYFGDRPMVYVSGNLLIFYIPGDRRRHVSPDVFVVIGVRMKKRPNYKVWEEGKGPTVVIEITSKTTKKEDLEIKFHLYQDVLKVQEYFLFDPFGDYLNPSMQGYRLVRGKYRPIDLQDGRLPSKVLGLHLERNGDILRLYDPAADKWLPTPNERLLEVHEAQLAAEAAKIEAESDRIAAERARQFTETENERLRRELEELRRRLPPTQ
jgi:Uma2 family endonuclease